MKKQSNVETSFNGKVALVTGGNSGIGERVVKQFLQSGAKVVSMDLRTGGKSIQYPEFEDFVDFSGDVSLEEDCVKAVKVAVAKFGSCDILVNAAGIVEKSRRTIKQSVEDWKRTMDVNLLGTYQMSRIVAGEMISAGRPGAIVNLASVAGLGGFKASNAYGVSKAAVIMLTKTMAVDLAERHIRVNAVAPGFIVTPMTADLQSSKNVAHEAFIQRIPLARFGEVEEVSRVILFLCSDWASYITGATIPVDGGWTAFSGPSNI